MVVKFDLKHGVQRSQKISAAGRTNFRSFTYQDVMYRLTVSRKEATLDRFGLSDGKLIDSATIVKDTVLKRTFVYLRNTKSHSVNKKETLYGLIQSGVDFTPSVVIPIQKDSSSKTIMWGTHYSDEGGPGFFPLLGIMLNPIGAIAGAIVWGTASQMVERAGISRYRYTNIESDSQLTLQETNRKSLRQIIDDYEIQLRSSGVVCQYKTYADTKNGCIGLYVDDHHHKLILTKFAD